MRGTANVSGALDIYLALETMKKSTANKVMRPALVKAGRLAVRKIKQTIPSRLKDLRKAVGSRSMKLKYTGKVATVKVGASVGKKRDVAKISEKDRTGRAGVGISKNNAHWFFLGTDERWQGIRRRRKKGAINYTETFTGNAIRYTGRMPAQSQSVKATLDAHAAELQNLIAKEMRIAFDKQVAKAKAKTK